MARQASGGSPIHPVLEVFISKGFTPMLAWHSMVGLGFKVQVSQMFDFYQQKYNADLQLFGQATPSLRSHSRYYAVTLVICLLVTILLWLLRDDSSFLRLLVFSLCVGSCTHLTTSLGILFWRNKVPIYFVMICSVLVGGMAGLALASLIFGIDLRRFFDSALSTLMINLMASSLFIFLYQLSEVREALRLATIKQLQQDKQLIETELRLLQSQIEPHFLFNTLSNVVSLMSTDTPKAETMLRRLTQFLRVSLRKSRNESSSLQDELELIDDYLSILQIRMEERLSYKLLVDIDASNILFPPLILQPLVENAVSHGLEPKEEGGSITIRIPAGDKLKIIIEDTGLGLDAESNGNLAGQIGGAGIGLSNVKARLQMLYGDQASFEINENQPTGLIISIELPKQYLRKDG